MAERLNVDCEFQVACTDYDESCKTCRNNKRLRVSRYVKLYKRQKPK